MSHLMIFRRLKSFFQEGAIPFVGTPWTANKAAQGQVSWQIPPWSGVNPGDRVASCYHLPTISSKNGFMVTIIGLSGIAMFTAFDVVCDVSLKGLCAWKASVYLSKRINSSLLTKIFNGIGWEGCETQRAIIGWPLLFIVRWVIRNKAWFKHNYKTMWCMESPHDRMSHNCNISKAHGKTHFGIITWALRIAMFCYLLLWWMSKRYWSLCIQVMSL